MVVVSLVFWGSLLGPVGMVLCIPLTMTVKFACEHNKGTRWIATLLGLGTPVDSMSPGRRSSGVEDRCRRGVVHGCAHPPEVREAAPVADSRWRFGSMR